MRRTASEGEITFAVSGTAVKILIPEWLKGCYVEAHAIDASVDVLLGASAVDCVYGQLSSIDGVTLAVTTHASSGRRILSGTIRAFIIPNDPNITHLSAEASGGGFLQLSKTSSKIGA